MHKQVLACGEGDHRPVCVSITAAATFLPLPLSYTGLSWCQGGAAPAPAPSPPGSSPGRSSSPWRLAGGELGRRGVCGVRSRFSPPELARVRRAGRGLRLGVGEGGGSGECGRDEEARWADTVSRVSSQKRDAGADSTQAKRTLGWWLGRVREGPDLCLSHVWRPHLHTSRRTSAPLPGQMELGSVLVASGRSIDILPAALGGLEGQTGSQRPQRPNQFAAFAVQRPTACGGSPGARGTLRFDGIATAKQAARYVP